MATAQTTKSSSRNDQPKKPQRSTARKPESASATGEQDESYNLVSVLYHALQGAETLVQYQADARENGDEALAKFFEETRGGYVQFAQQAKQLLAERLDSEDEADDADDDDEE